MSSSWSIIASNLHKFALQVVNNANKYTSVEIEQCFEDLLSSIDIHSDISPIDIISILKNACELISISKKLKNRNIWKLSLPDYAVNFITKLFSIVIQNEKMGEFWMDIICKLIANINEYDIIQNTHKTAKLSIVTNILICKQLLFCMNETSIDIKLDFTKNVEIFSLFVNILNNFDIQRVLSVMYFDRELWSMDVEYHHPKIALHMNNKRMNAMLAKNIVYHFFIVLFHLSSVMNLLLKTLMKNADILQLKMELNHVIFNDLTKDRNGFRMYNNLRNSIGFSVPMQMRIRECIIQFVRYCYYFILLSNKQTVKYLEQEFTETEIISIRNKFNIKELLNISLDVHSQMHEHFQQIICEITVFFNLHLKSEMNEEIKEEDEIKEHSCNVLLFKWLKYFAPLWRKEIIECHKIRLTPKKNIDEPLIVRKYEHSQKWKYYQKYSSERKYNKVLIDKQNVRMGECWKYLSFLTRFELQNIIQIAEENESLKEMLFMNMEYLLPIIIKLVHDADDNHKYFGLQSLKQMIECLFPTCNPTNGKTREKNYQSFICKYSPIILNTLQYALAFTNDNNSSYISVVFPMIIFLVNDEYLLSIQQQMKVHQSRYYSNSNGMDLNQSSMIVAQFESIYDDINRDAIIIIHSGSKNLLKKEVILFFFSISLFIFIEIDGNSILFVFIDMREDFEC